MDPDELVVPQDWFQLSEMQRNSYARMVVCPYCRAEFQRSCQSTQPRDGIGKVDAWTGLEHFHPQRHAEAQMRYSQDQRRIEAEIRRQKIATADEIARTCPWCGYRVDPGVALATHEVDCDG